MAISLKAWKTRYIPPVRISTKADACAAVNKFIPDELNFCGVTMNRGDHTVIKPYDSLAHYCYDMHDVLKVKTPLYVIFNNDDRDKFFEDKVNYLIDFFNFRYPEYRWVGVC